MESYLLAQERSWFDFMPDCFAAGECISYFRTQKGYEDMKKGGSFIPKNTGETLYLGSTSSELYMCDYQKNYEQYVKNDTDMEDTEIKNRFDIGLLTIWTQNAQPFPSSIIMYLCRQRGWKN